MRRAQAFLVLLATLWFVAGAVGILRGREPGTFVKHAEMESGDPTRVELTTHCGRQ